MLKEIYNHHSVKNYGSIKEPTQGRPKPGYFILRDKTKVVDLKYLSIDKAIELVRSGFKVNSSRLKMGRSNAVQGSTVKGVIEFYYDNKFHSSRIVNDIPARKEFMAATLKNCMNLQGEKMFLWKPKF